MGYIFGFVFCVIFIILFLYFEKEIYSTPYTWTSGYKKLKVKPAMRGNGEMTYVMMHQLPISRRWIPVIQCLGRDCYIPLTFDTLDEVEDFTKKHKEYMQEYMRCKLSI